MTPDDAYGREELAELYDMLNPDGPDTAFYLSLARSGEAVLDIGCGTGNVALQFAGRGHDVTGVDPAPGMLSVARRNDRDGKVEWIAATGQDFRTHRRFDLAIMTGHVFQVFLTDQDMLAVLRNAWEHLKPGGRIVFESRNPLKREWEAWTRELDRSRIVSPHVGSVDVHYQWLETNGELVTFETVFAFETGRTERSVTTLRFASHDKIADLVTEAGFSKIDWLGSWDGSPFSDGSPEIIVTAWR